MIRADCGTENTYVAAGREDLKEIVDLDDVDVAEESCCHRSPGCGCVEEFTHLVSIIMQEQNLNMATTAEEAVIIIFHFARDH